MEFSKVSTYVLTDPHDYPSWSGKVQAIVQSNDSLATVFTTNESGATICDRTAEADVKLKFYNYLLISTDGRPQRIVMRTPSDGTAAWQALKDEYAPDDPYHLQQLRTELFKVECTAADTVEAFLDRVEDIQFQSKVTQSQNAITDAEVQAHVCRMLPDKYQPIISVFPADGEWSKLRSQLRSFDRRVSKPHDAFSPALVASKKPQTTSPADWCIFCDRKGHNVTDCRAMQRAKKMYQEQRPRRGGHSDQGNYKAGGAAAFLGSEHQQGPPSATGTTTFVVDSGASQHVCGNPHLFSGPMVDCKVQLTMVNGDTVQVTKRGTVVGTVINEAGGRTELVIKDTLFLPGNINLLSVHRISAAGHKLQTGPRPVHNVITLDKSAVKLPLTLDQHGLRCLQLCHRTPTTPAERALAVTEPPAHAKSTPVLDIMLAHQRLGHLNYADIKKLQHANAISTTGNFTPCETCLTTKSKRAAVAKKAQPRVTLPGELIHTDINGPMSVPTISGHRYAIEFIDDATRYVQIYLMKTKDEALSKFKQYVADMLPLGIPIGAGSTLQADNDSVYRDRSFADFTKARQIKMQFSPPHTQALNGVAERSWNTVVDMARAMLHDSGLEHKFWGAAMLHSAFVRNVCPSSAVSAPMTPFEIVHGKPFELSKLRKFGAKAFVHVERQHRTKFSDKARGGLYIGHALHSGTHKVYIPASRRVVETIHAKFIENPAPNQGGGHHQQQLHVTPITIGSVEEAVQPKGEHALAEPATGSTTKKPTPAAPATDDAAVESDSGPDSDASSSGCDLLSDFSDTGFTAVEADPKTIRQAQASPQADDWVAAIHAELQSLRANGTWEEVHREQLPRGSRVLQSRFLFKTKLDQHGKVARYKARLVALGHLQREGIDYHEVYAPVAQLTTLRVLFALAASCKRAPQNMDITTAFLQAEEIKEEIYLAPPAGLDHDPNTLFKLLKPIYGLKQAPREWNNTIHKWMVDDFGFRSSYADPCLYVYRDAEQFLAAVIWVDDIVYFGNSDTVEQKFAAAIADRFAVKLLGTATFVLGIQVKADPTGITLTQTKYIEEILAKTNMSKCKPASTPMIPHTVLQRFNEQDEHDPDPQRQSLPPPLAKLYREVVGSLIYLVSCTRPDIANAVSQLSQCVSHPLREHLAAAKHVLRYLRGSAELGITYSTGADQAADTVLVGYADASYGTVPHSRRSITGYVFMVANGAVSWKTKVQPTVALSTAEAEYMAACAAVQEAKFLRNVLADFGFAQPPTVINEDNQPAINIAENRLTSHRTKHIDIKYHFIREAIIEGIIKLQYIPTAEQLADIFTKILPAPQMAKLRDAIAGLRELPR